jgi:hypothetical protein
MIIKELLLESENFDDHKEIFMKMFKKFLPIAMQYIDINSLPEMEFVASLDNDEQPTFGRYETGARKLTVALMNRHPNDILRTIAHELVHFKQDVNDELNNNSGETGSPEENQAHQIAGVVMRHFNQQHPEFLKSKPIT